MIALGIQFALNAVVDGFAGLYNEVKKEWVPAPCYDHTDPSFLIHLKEICLPKFDYLLVDEGQDMTRLDTLTARKLVARDGGLCVFDDDAQSLYEWAGSNREARAELLCEARTLQSPINYRQGMLLVEHAQGILNAMGRDMVIRAARDVQGSIENTGFYNSPIDFSVSNMVLFRMKAHMITAYGCFLSKVIPAIIIGEENTADSLLHLLGDDDLPMSRISLWIDRKMKLYESSSNMDDTYDLYACLRALLDNFAELPNSIDLSLPEARGEFQKFVHGTFKPADGNIGVVRLSTIHRAKGSQAHTVYIAQPELIPLEERIAKGDWNTHEERCCECVAYTRRRVQQTASYGYLCSSALHAAHF